MPNKVVKGLKVNGRDGVPERHNGHWGERKSNQLGDANFMEHHLRRVFYDTFFKKTKQHNRCLLARGPRTRVALSSPPFTPLFASTSAALSKGSNGMAPPLGLSSPTLGKWGSVCLLFWKAACLVYHCQRTETHKKKRIEKGWGGSAVQSVPLWALRPRAPRGEYPTLDPYISISAFRAPTGFVSAHSGCQDMCLRC